MQIPKETFIKNQNVKGYYDIFNTNRVTGTFLVKTLFVLQTFHYKC